MALVSFKGRAGPRLKMKRSLELALASRVENT